MIARRLRGEGRCSAELERTPRAQPPRLSPQLPWKPHSSPACIPTDCSAALSFSSLLCFSCCLFHFSFNSCLFFLFLFLFLLFLWRVRCCTFCVDAHSASTLISGALHSSVAGWIGNYSLFSIPLHSQMHKHFVVFSASLYFYFPFCSAPCFSKAPSSHCISAHTQGTLASSLLFHGICHGPAAPSSYFSKYPHLLVSF